MIYFVIFYFCLLLILSIRHHKWIVFKYLVGVYLFSLFISLYIIKKDVFNDDQSITASLIFCIGISLLFLPYYRNTPRIQFTIDNARVVSMFKRIGFIIGSSFVLFMILGIPAITKALLVGALDIRNDESTDFISDLSRIPRYGCYVLYYFHGISYTLLIMFSFSFVFLEKEKLLSALLFLASLSAPYMGVLVGGRTNLVYWLLLFIMCILLFFPYLNKKRKFQLIIPTSAILFVLSVYFIVTTNARFEYSKDLSASESVELYAGKSYIGFCEFFDKVNCQNYTLRRVLPLTTSLFEGKFDLIEYRDKIEAATGYEIGTFYTLLGDLYVDLGLIGMLLYCLLYFALVNHVLGKKKVFYIEDLIILGILVQIPLHGLFYYSYWHVRSSLSILLLLLFAFLLKQARNKKVRKYDVK